MSSRHPYPVQSTSREVVEIIGSFAPDTASAPTDLQGKGYTVAHTSTGLFTLTLDKVYPSCLSAVVSLQLATGADRYVQVGTIDLSAKTVQIRVWDVSGAAVADIAANANNRVNFRLAFKNSGV